MPALMDADAVHHDDHLAGQEPSHWVLAGDSCDPGTFGHLERAAAENTSLRGLSHSTQSNAGRSPVTRAPRDLVEYAQEASDLLAARR